MSMRTVQQRLAPGGDAGDQKQSADQGERANEDRVNHANERSTLALESDPTSPQAPFRRRGLGFATMSEPAFSVLSDDDPDSVKVKAFLKRWIWPGAGGLLLMIAFVGVFKLNWAFGLVQLIATGWLIGQIIVRPGPFLISVRNGFGKATALLAACFGQHAKRHSKDEPKPQDVRRFMPGEKNAQPEPQLAAAPRATRKRINWLEIGDGALRLAPWVLGAIVLAALYAVVWKPLDRWINGGSGREVAAEANANNARSETITANAESERASQSIVIVETTNRGRDHARAATEEALVAVAAHPDLEAGFAEYSARAQRLRNEGRTAVSGAVQQHAAGE